MIAGIRKLLESQPFEPSTIHTSGGKHYRVATRDHASIHPKQTRVIVYFDDDSSLSISPLHITSLEQSTAPN